MAITFPASPVNGQTHTENGQIFVFDSTRGYWLLKKQDQIVASTSRSTFVATAGQTVHTVNYDPSASVIVSVNGVMLNPQDITSTNGTSIIFDTALALSDEVDIVFHQPTASNLIRQDISDPMATESYVQTYVTNNSSVGVTTVADMAALIALTGMANGDQALVTANNNLFIYSGSGWYKIATVQNDSPSAITGVSGTYELAIDGTATTITAASTDPEGFPLTWSYSTSGLGSIATVSHVDNVFTITPSTNEADIGTFTLTINATDGVNGAVSTTTNLTLEFIVIVTNSKYTTLLATAVDTSDNNNITDSSSNSHSITVNGDAYAGTFSPYRSGGYSTYFDGSGDDLTIADHTSFDFGTSDFTIETWFYLASDDGTYTICAQYSSGNSGGIWLGRWANGFVFRQGGIADVITASSHPSANEWHHIAVSRLSGSTRMFIDGTQVGSTVTSDTNNYSVSAPMHIGSDGDTTDDQKLNGYLSDFRIVKGTGLYTSNFTPTTERLTTVSGTGYSTSLLTCHLPYIADGSTNSHSITVNGDVSTKPFSPYDYGEYSAANYGGSIVINSTSAWVQSTVTAPSTGSFAVECWVYWDEFPNTSNGNHQSIISFKGADNYDGVRLMYKSPSSEGFAVYANDSWFMSQSSSPLKVKVWYHAAITYDGTNLRLFVNGSLINTAAFSTDLTNTDLRIGNDDWWRMGLGKVSDVRYTRGSAVYTTDFTPPTAPLSSSGAELHLKGTDASIIDKAQGSNLKLAGNTTGSTTQVKFANTKSMYFDGTGDYLETSATSIDTFNFGTGDFTVELHLRNVDQTGYTYFDILGTANNGAYLGSNRGGWMLSYYTSSFLKFNYQYNNVWVFENSFAQTLNINTWYHIAVTRQGTQLKCFVEGNQVGSTITNSTNLISTEPLSIGRGYGGGVSTNSYIQDLRITKGLARYTANFTPPTASLEG